MFELNSAKLVESGESVLAGRGYVIQDLDLVTSLEPVVGYLAALVLALM